ncbi:MAG: hypothetical protein ACK43M_11640 [Allorhizobium sp.]
MLYEDFTIEDVYERIERRLYDEPVRRPKKRKHPLHGKRGPLLEDVQHRDGRNTSYFWQLRGDEIIRGKNRAGHRAADFALEAAYSNDRSNPQFELSRILIETLAYESTAIRAKDVALFWFLFALARPRFGTHAKFTVSLDQVKSYLNVHDRSRIASAMSRLADTDSTFYASTEATKKRVSSKLLHSVVVDKKTVTYTFEPLMIATVLHARDYAWVDINALTRFDSKFTAPVFMSLCLYAGMHQSNRPYIDGSLAAFGKMMRLPEGTRDSVRDEAIERVRDDLLAIDGPRRRFKIEFSMARGEDGFVSVRCGDALRKLKEVKTKNLSEAQLKSIKGLYSRVLDIERKRWPSMQLRRAAATLLGMSVYDVSDSWRTDVYGALSTATPCVGLSAEAFLREIETDVDKAFERWISKKKFPANVVCKQRVDVGTEIAKVRKTKTAAVETVVVERDIEEREDDQIETVLTTELEYGVDVEAHSYVCMTDIDDSDIPY